MTVSKEQMDALLAVAAAKKARRTETMPDEAAALAQMFEAWQRLKELGWKEIEYCPKDGTTFSAIEAGSVGIHECNFQGEWPHGRWWIYDGDAWPARPILWRARKPDDPIIRHAPITFGAVRDKDMEP